MGQSPMGKKLEPRVVPYQPFLHFLLEHPEVFSLFIVKEFAL